MDMFDSALLVKRKRKKILSQKVAFMLLDYAKSLLAKYEMENRGEIEQRKERTEYHRNVNVIDKTEYDKIKTFINSMVRQVRCSSCLHVIDNKFVVTYFCGQKTCLVCNSIRAAKFLDKYKKPIEALPFIYHMVLSIKNPGNDDLKADIDKMFKFFNRSSIKRNKRFVELNKKVKFIRSFETTFNKRTRSYNIHFHILLGGEKEDEVKEYGSILIDYWLKYFGKKANRKAQYFEKQEKSILENFKYLFKLKDITGSEIPLLYNFLQAVKYRKLFTAKNIVIEKREDDNYQFEKEKHYYIYRSEKFEYHKESESWINPGTGEIYPLDDFVNNYKEEMMEIKNYRELNEFFRENKLKDIPKPYEYSIQEEFIF